MSTWPGEGWISTALDHLYAIILLPILLRIHIPKKFVLLKKKLAKVNTFIFMHKNNHHQLNTYVKTTAIK